MRLPTPSRILTSLNTVTKVACAPVLLAALALPAVNNHAYAHCQVPCGIFDDAARVKMLLEEATTITKAINEANKLNSMDDAQSLNQQVRWIKTKEDHASTIITTISEYFMAQRIKTNMEDYADRLVKHHAVMIAAMKAKQSSDPAAAETLVTAIMAIAPFYPDHHHHH